MTGGERQRTPEATTTATAAAGAGVGVGVVIIIGAPSATPDGISSIPKPTI